MKFLAIFLISLLFIQAIVEASDAAHSLSQEDAGGSFESLATKMVQCAADAVLRQKGCAAEHVRSIVAENL
ncbi:hypothetical protein BUALT_Bualt08G0133700 [Buddleja alternifolia]|uniref:Uncharacterized protein n=1 Tax=Buddleja alternifolia TaxID=168488 RepID=A0AAV6XCP6_9LAMI|nr:hypothetical protein BUALT_Bualt08G0133700 [Buddleja alternifolia]